MIYRIERLAGSHGNRLGRHQSGQYATDQARPRGHRDGIQPVKTNAGFSHGFLDQPVEVNQMRSRGDLRYDTAIGRMFCCL
jgi:hypothetical protein